MIGRDGSGNGVAVPPSGLPAQLETARQALADATTDFERLRIRDAAAAVKSAAEILKRRDIQVSASLLVASAERAIAAANPAKSRKEAGAMKGEKVVIGNHDLSRESVRQIRAAHDMTDERFEAVHAMAAAVDLPLSRADYKALSNMATDVEAVSAVANAAERGITVSRAATQLRRAANIDERFAALNAAALPEGVFGLIYADPPWPHTRTGYTESGGGAAAHYPTMSLEEIAALPVADLAADDCVLYMWIVAPFLESAFPIMKAWGFQYSTNMVWGKPRMGQGFRVRGQHEILLVGVRGKFPQPAPEDVPPSLFVEPPGLPMRRHSEKPGYYYELFERLYPGVAKVELFARSRRDGWTAWGNEALEDSVSGG